MREAARKAARRTSAGVGRARAGWHRAECRPHPCVGRGVARDSSTVASAGADGSTPHRRTILVAIARQVARGECWSLDAGAALYRAIGSGVRPEGAILCGPTRLAPGRRGTRYPAARAVMSAASGRGVRVGGPADVGSARGRREDSVKNDSRDDSATMDFAPLTSPAVVRSRSSDGVPARGWCMRARA
jgi:hypothetical protein